MPPELYAVRLGRAYGPGSSAAALIRALERPLDGLETDCCLTADGELVLLHRPAAPGRRHGVRMGPRAHHRSARAGPRRRDGTASYERPLLPDELLELAPPGATLQLEGKVHADLALASRTVRALCEWLRHHPASERTEVIGFWSGACEQAAAHPLRANCGSALLGSPVGQQ